MRPFTRPKLLSGLVVTAGLTAIAIGALTLPQGDVQAQSAGPRADGTHVTRGFSVEISGATGKEVDTAWESVSGGGVNIVTDQFHTTTPGHKYVDTLTLRGPITATRKSANGAAAPQDEPLKAGNFKVDIEGAPAASANIESVEMEDLTVEVVDTGKDDADGYRVYQPGQPQYGNITMKARVGKSKELQTWWQESAKGKGIRKSISIILLKRDGSKGREYTWHECFLIGYTAFEYDGTGGAAYEKINVRCEQLEVTVEGRRKQMMQWIMDTARGKGPRMTIAVTEITRDGATGRTVTYTDGFPVRYTFPSLSAGATGNVSEEIAIKPIRVELK